MHFTENTVKRIYHLESTLARSSLLIGVPESLFPFHATRNSVSGEHYVLALNINGYRELDPFRFERRKVPRKFLTFKVTPGIRVSSLIDRVKGR